MPNPFCLLNSSDCTILPYHAKHHIALRLSLHECYIVSIYGCCADIQYYPLLHVGVNGMDPVGFSVRGVWTMQCSGLA
jgi:hypothetical protein